MKVVIQRVKEARALEDTEVISSINKGLLLLLCFEVGDLEEDFSTIVEKLCALRIFDDQDGKMNLSVTDLNLDIMCISQFTLAWEGKKGNRPSFEKALEPMKAKIYYRLFLDELKKTGLNIQKGKFGAMLDLHIINNGPVTLHLNF